MEEEDENFSFESEREVGPVAIVIAESGTSHYSSDSSDTGSQW